MYDDPSRVFKLYKSVFIITTTPSEFSWLRRNSYPGPLESIYHSFHYHTGSYPVVIGAIKVVLCWLTLILFAPLQSRHNKRRRGRGVTLPRKVQGFASEGDENSNNIWMNEESAGEQEGCEKMGNEKAKARRECVEVRDLSKDCDMTTGHWQETGTRGCSVPQSQSVSLGRQSHEQDYILKWGFKTWSV